MTKIKQGVFMTAYVIKLKGGLQLPYTFKSALEAIIRAEEYISASNLSPYYEIKAVNCDYEKG